MAGPFLLDDATNIPQARVAELSLDTLSTAMAENVSGPLGRPISVLTFSLNHYFGDDTAFGFKLVNLILHLLIGGLLFALGGRVLWRLGAGAGATGVAAAVTALWLLHPLNVSTVLYVVQRMTQLSTLFMLAGMLAYVAGRERQLADKRGGFPLVLAAIFVFTPLAAFSKETGLLLPGFLLLLEVLLFRFAVQRQTHRVPLIALLAGTCLLPIVLAVLYHLTHWDALLGGYSTRPFTMEERLLTQPHVLLLYIRQIFLPRLSLMGLYLDDFPVTQAWDAGTAAAVAVLAAMLAAAALVWRRAPLLSLGIAWFFLAHALESTIFPLEMVFEHRNYLAMWGLLLPAVWYGRQLFVRIAPDSRAGALVLGLVLTLAGALTFLRVQTFVDFPTFLVTSHQDHPNSPRATTYMGMVNRDQGRMDEARAFFALAAAQAPYEPGIPLIDLYTYCQDTPPPDALLQSIQGKLRHGLLTVTARNKLGELAWPSFRKNCPNIPAGVALGLIDAGLANPGARDPRKANPLYYAKGLLLLQEKRHDEASHYLRKAYETNTGPMRHRLPALITLAGIQLQTGKLDEAGKTLQLLRELNARKDVNIDKDVSNLESIRARLNAQPSAK